MLTKGNHLRFWIVYATRSKDSSPKKFLAHLNSGENKCLRKRRVLIDYAEEGSEPSCLNTRSARTAAAQASLPVLPSNASCRAVCFLPSLESTCQITLLPPKINYGFPPVPFCAFMLLDRWSHNSNPFLVRGHSGPTWNSSSAKAKDLNSFSIEYLNVLFERSNSVELYVFFISSIHLEVPFLLHHTLYYWWLTAWWNRASKCTLFLWKTM